MWDVSVGGSAIAGDDSAQAAEREVFEELGLKLNLKGKRPVFTMNFSDGFDDYYIVNQDVNIEELHLQKEEVKQVRWVDREDALQMQCAKEVGVEYIVTQNVKDFQTSEVKAVCEEEFCEMIASIL